MAKDRDIKELRRQIESLTKVCAVLADRRIDEYSQIKLEKHSTQSISHQTKHYCSNPLEISGFNTDEKDKATLQQILSEFNDSTLEPMRMTELIKKRKRHIFNNRTKSAAQSARMFANSADTSTINSSTAMSNTLAVLHKRHTAI